jgi:ribonuclease P/MRP protein subunit RPP1
MAVIDTKNVEKAKKEIKNSKEKAIIVLAQDDDFNRKILEYGKFDVLLSPEGGGRRNTIRQIDSGFNHVLGKIATKNGVAIGVDLKEVRGLGKVEKAKRLARICQNIKICRRTKTRIVVLGSLDKNEAFCFLISLGASSKQGKDAMR